MMNYRIYKKNNVYQEAQERISFIFDNFEHVVVGMSGGKDSTVVFNLCLREAEKRGRLPLEVLFIDQEAEWASTIDYIKRIMYDKRVKPYWLQVPIRLFNATSHEKDNWLHCWKEGEPWIRQKDPISIKENIYGTDRFKSMFDCFMKVTFKDCLDKVCAVGGVRAEESPARRVGLTSTAKFKYITWGNKSGGSYTFYPIYDWSYTDVWHAIASNKWPYNRVYDEFYKLGVPTYKMRVSNLNHETAVKSLYYVQEIEPDTWNKLVARMNGIDTTSKIKYEDNFMSVKELPWMFKNWKEYRDYLLEHIVVDEEQRETFRKRFEKADRELFGSRTLMDGLYKTEITCILANDYTFTKLDNHMLNESHYRKLVRGQGVGVYNNDVKNLVEEIYGE